MFLAITFEPIEIQTRSISQNKHQNLINLGFSMQFVSKMTLSRLKSAIYESQILRTTLYFLNIKFQEKIVTSIKVIQLWNFGNFGTSEIIPKNLVTLRFSKVSSFEPKGRCKCFQMRYWPNFYVDQTHSNSYFFKVGKQPVFMQATVYV